MKLINQILSLIQSIKGIPVCDKEQGNTGIPACDLDTDKNVCATLLTCDEYASNRDSGRTTWITFTYIFGNFCIHKKILAIQI